MSWLAAFSGRLYVCVCVCVRVRVHVPSVRASVRECVCERVRVRVCVCVSGVRPRLRQQPVKNGPSEKCPFLFPCWPGITYPNDV